MTRCFDPRVVRTNNRGGTHAALAFVEVFLEEVIPLASAKHADKEGAVQGASRSFLLTSKTMLDQELALSFHDTSTKTRSSRRSPQVPRRREDRSRGAGSAPDPVRRSNGVLSPWTHVLRSSQSRSNRRMSGSIAWASIQAAVYAELFTRWLRIFPRSAAAVQAGGHHPRHARSANPAGARFPDPHGASRPARVNTRRRDSTRSKGSSPRSPQIRTRRHP